MKEVYGYSRLKKSANKESTIELFSNYDCVEIILDDSSCPKSDDSPLQKLKQILINTNAAILIDSIDSLGKTSREIAKELNWFKSNNIELLVISLPSTFSDNQSSMSTLLELYNDKASKERTHVSEGQHRGQLNAQNNNIRTGRPLTPYPSNWNENFSLWQTGSITATEFMNRAKVKKGTFYNLVKRYKEDCKLTSNELLG